MRTETEIREALSLVKFPDAKTKAAFERQLRANNPGAWFVIAAKKRAKV